MLAARTTNLALLALVLLTGTRAPAQNLTMSGASDPLPITDPPLILTAQPAGGVVSIGQATSLVVTVTGTLPAFQWFKDGARLTGQTNRALTFASFQFTDGGSYRVAITNALGMVLSRPALLSVPNAPLKAWGFNDDGQLGNGNRTQQNTPVTVSSHAVAVATGESHSLFVESDGTLWAMGRNSAGQLGLGSTPTSTNRPAIVASNVVAVAAGANHSLFVKDDGTLWTMGENGYGQLGIGTKVSAKRPVYVTNNVVAVAAGSYHSLFVKADGALWAMGQNTYGQLGTATGTSTNRPAYVAGSVVAVTAGAGHSLFAKADGTLWAMGLNIYGGLGIGTSDYQVHATPVNVASNVIAMAAGYAHSLFVKSDGMLWSMGYNTYGQLGNGNIRQQNSPVRAGSNVVAVAAGHSHSLFAKADGTLWAMGVNSYGALGMGTQDDLPHASPLNVPGLRVATLPADGRGKHALAVAGLTLQFASLTNQTILAGQPFTFTLVVTSGDLLACQWQFNGTNITGATSASYSVANGLPAHAGTYTAVFTGPTGAGSASATLTFSLPPTATVLTRHTGAASQAYGTPLTYAARVTPDPGDGSTVSFDTGTGAGLGSATTTGGWAYLPVSLSYSNSAYTVSASFAGNPDCAGSRSASLSQTITRANLSVSANPRNKTYGSVLALGSSAFTSSGLQCGESIGSVTLSSGGTAATAAAGPHPITPASATGGTFDPNNYTLSYADGTLTVNPLTAVLTGTRLYDGTAVATASILTLANALPGDPVTVASGTATLAGALPGTRAITSLGTLTLDGASAANYTLAGAGGSVMIASSPLILTAQPAGGIVSIGQATSLTATVTGTLPAFQWFKDGARLTGQTNRTLTFASFQFADAGSYRLAITNAAGVLISRPALLSVPNALLKAWGDPYDGQLGKGDTFPQYTPVTVTSNAVAVATGHAHSLFVKSDGTLWAMGRNSAGQLGNGNTDQQDTPVYVASNVVAVAAGDSHSLFVKANSTLWAMGENGFGQLGNGHTTRQTSPVCVASNVVAVAAGDSHSLFVKSDGALWAMGRNVYGQLGIDNTDQQDAPVCVASNVVAVAAGSFHSLFAAADGTLWTMGFNSCGQLGNGTADTVAHTTPVSVASHVRAIAAGSIHSLFAKTDGTLWTMGDNTYGQLGNGLTTRQTSPVNVGSNVVAVAAGYWHSLFVKADGSLWTLGDNTYGELGLGTSDATAHSSPLNVPGLRVASLPAGGLGWHSLAVAGLIPQFASLTDLAIVVGQPFTFTLAVTGGDLFTCQWQFNGTNIAGATSTRYAVANGLTAHAGTYTVVFTSPTGAGSESAALTVTLHPTTTTVLSRQTGSASQAYGTPLTYAARVTPDPGNGSTVSFNTGAGAGLGSATTTGGWAYLPVHLSYSNSAYTVTANFAGSSDYMGSRSATLSQTITRANLSVSANPRSKTYGSVLTLGSSAFTSSGLQYGESIGSVTLSSGGTAATAAAGPYSITPASATGGTFNPGNYTLSYSAGTLTVNPLPAVLTGTRFYDGTTVAAASILTLSNALPGDTVTVASGMATLAGALPGTRAIVSMGTLTLAGASAANYTLAGAGGSVAIANPSPVILTTQPAGGVVSIGQATSLVVTVTGDLPAFQWFKDGARLTGQTNRTLTFASFRFTDAGSYRVAITNALGMLISRPALLSVPNAPLKAWGYNAYGQLGNASTDPQYAPLTVSGNAVAGAAGAFHALFVKTDGSLWAMGRNNYGQLGNGTTGQQDTPASVAGNVVAVTAGYDHSLFVKADGSLWAMGNNACGQLGIGSTPASTNRPTYVAGNVVAVAAGYMHTLFVKTDGTLWAMGSNSAGQLGMGTQDFIPHATPVCVASNVVAVTAGDYHSLFAKADGTLWAMGNNTQGELGLGAAQLFAQPTPVNVAGDVTAMAAGYGYSLFVKTDGSLWTMGYNNYGQLGNGNTTRQTSPVNVDSNVVAVAAGYSHALFAKADGTLWAMGVNTYGQLGLGTQDTAAHSTPLNVPGLRVASLPAGGRGWHSLAVAALIPQIVSPTNQTILAGQPFSFVTSGDILTCQWQFNGTNITGATSASYAVAGSRTTHAGTYTIVFTGPTGAGSASGTLTVNPLPTTTVLSRQTGSASQAYGTPLTYAARVTPDPGNGSTVSFDTGAGACLGSATTTGGWAYLPVNLSYSNSAYTVSASFAGNPDYVGSRSATLSQTITRATLSVSASPRSKTYGSVLALGSSAFTSSGLQYGESIGSVTLSGSGTAATAAAGPYSITPASATGGTFNPDNYTLSYSAGTLTVNPLPAVLTGTRPYDGTAVATASILTLTNALPGDTVTVASGTATLAGALPGTRAIVSVGTLTLAGASAANYTLAGAGGSVTLTGSSPILVLTAQPAGGVVSIGQATSLVVTVTGSLPAFQWFKDGARLTGQTNRTLTFASFQFTDAGSYRVAITNAVGVLISRPALLSVPNAPLKAWGYNASGQLGTGNNYFPPYAPVTVSSNALAAAMGSDHSVFAKADGSLWTMGNNNYGQLGNGTTTRQYAPVNVAGNVVAVAAGYDHSLFVKADGSLWAMGNNQYGQLGIGSTPASTNLPIYVASNVVAVAAGDIHSLFVKADGTLWAMGSNSYGQLGNGNTTRQNVPVCVATDVVAVAAGGRHSLFAETDGSLWTMGENTYGQLGIGTWDSSAHATPVRVASDVIAMAAGYRHSLFVKANGSLWAMGDNTHGQLGNGNTTRQTSPVNVDSNVVTVAAGDEHALFVKADGTLWTMGDNTYGQLGLGTQDTAVHSTPLTVPGVRVASLPAGGRGWHSLAVAALIPQIVSPTNQTILAGQPFSFVTSGDILTCQWQFNGTNITGATSTRYAVAGSRTTHAGTYTVVFTGPTGAASASGTLTVNPLPTTTVLSRQTGSASQTYGTPLTYAARVTPDPGNGSTVSFDTGAGACLGSATTTGGWAYLPVTLSYSNSAYTVSAGFAGNPDYAGSRSDTLSQTITRATLSVSASPRSKTYGSVLALGSSAFTSSGLQYGESIGSVTLSGSGTAATAAAGPYSITPASATGGTFNPDNYTLSYSAGTLTVNPLPAVLTGTRPYDGTAVATASILTLTNALPGDTVTVASGTATLAGALPGTRAIASVGTLALAGASAANYTLAGAGGSVTITGSSPILVLTAQPAGGVVSIGQATSLVVTVTGSLPAFQWFKDGARLTGQTNRTLNFASFQFTDGGSYSVAITNALGVLISRPALLSVPNAPLKAWGDNASGQLGTGNTLNRYAPVSVSANAVAGDAGAFHSLFVKADGSLWAMGRNNYGQLGIGTSDGSAHATPVRVASDVIAMAAGYEHALFVKADSTLWTMGQNNYGQLGMGTQDYNPHGTPVCVASNVVAVAAGDKHSLFVKADGTLWAMGSNYYGQLGNGNTTQQNVPVCVATNVVAVAAGGSHSLFAETDGSLWTMGQNNDGQLGIGTSDSVAHTTPVSVASDVIAMAAGYRHSLFVKTGGSLWAMGYNNYGQLGNGNTTRQTSPVNVGNDVAAVAAGSYHSTFAKADGTLWAMGVNNYGQLGLGTQDTAVHSTPLNVTGLRVASLAGLGGSSGHNLAVAALIPQIVSPTNQTILAGQPFSFVTSGDILTCQWQFNGTNITGATSASYAVAASRTTHAGTYTVVFTGLTGAGSASGTLTVNPLPVVLTGTRPEDGTTAAAAAILTVSNALPGDTVTVASGTATLSGALPGARAIVSVGTLTLGGASAANYTLAGASGSVTLARLPLALTTQPAGGVVSIGQATSLIATVTGILPAFQWFKDDARLTGQTNRTLNFASFQFADGGSYRVVITNALDMLISRPALLSVPNAPLKAWGDNAYGQLGNGNTTQQTSPVTVSGNAVAGAAGAFHSLFVKADGSLWAMGRNLYGQLGNGNATQQNVPVCMGDNVVTAAAGLGHSLFVKADSTLWTMGRNNYGQLGIGSTPTSTNLPAYVATNVVAVAAGDDHSLFVKADGSLWAMGYNLYGQLGNGNTTQQNVPVCVASNVVAVAAGESHSLFAKADGSLWTMGQNTYGQLGIGTSDSSAHATPVRVASDVIAMAAGLRHSLFVKTDGSLWAMGYNFHGQLGTGSMTQKTSPVNVGGNVVAVAAGRSHSLFAKADGTLWAMGKNSVGQLGLGTDGGVSPTPLTVPGVRVASLPAGGRSEHNLAVAARIPQIVSPTSQTILAGQPFSFVTSGDILTCQWQFNGTNITGATSASYAVAGSRTTHAGTYTIVFTGPTGAGSASGTLTVNPLPVVLTGTRPEDGTTAAAAAILTVSNALPGDTVTVASGTATLAGALPGARAIVSVGTLTLGGASAANYTLAGASGSVTLARVPLTLTTQPAGGGVSIGQATSLIATVTGIFPAFQWFKDGARLTGQTNRTLNFASFQFTDGGSYRVVITNALDMLISQPALLSVPNAPLKAWGYNNYGQLGTGNTLNRYAPVTVSSNAVAVTTGYNHSLFVKADGSLWAMGRNTYGQLGTGNTTQQNVPVCVGGNVVAAAAGNEHSLFVKADSTLWTMGRNNYGQLGIGSTPATTNRPAYVATNVVAVAAGNSDSFFLKADGSLWAMGNNGARQLGIGSSPTSTNRPAYVAGNVVAVAAGDTHSFFVKADGTLWAMGDNTYGQLGTGNTTRPTFPVNVANKVRTIAADERHSLFVKTDGSLWAMGYNTYGQLGNRNTTQQNFPVNVDNDVVAVAAGSYHSKFAKADGTLWAMGSNNYGHLGLGSSDATTHSTPLNVTGLRVASLPAGGYVDHTLAVAGLTPQFASLPDQTISTDQPFTFTLVVTSGDLFTCQWQFNGTNITGATRTSYPVTNGRAAHAGTYTAVFTGPDGAGSASATLTVNRAAPNVTAWPTATAITYGQTLAASTLNGGSATQAGHFDWTTPALAPAAGTAVHSATFTPDDPANYTVLTNPVSVTVAAAHPQVTNWPTGSTIINGQPLSASILTGGAASVPGSFSWLQPDAIPATGSHLAAGVFAPDASANYLRVTNLSAIALTVIDVPRAPVQSGAWHSPATWGGSVPGPGAPVTVPAALTVTLQGSINVASLTLLGTLNLGTNTLQLSGDFTNNGTFDPGVGTVSLVGGSNQVLTATEPATLSFYNLVVDKTPATATVTAADHLTVQGKLTITRGRLVSASDYQDILIDTEGELQLTRAITVSGDFTNNGTLTTAGHTLTFDGGVAQNLSLAHLTCFDDVTVTTGTTLIETQSGDNALIQGTLFNQGIIRKTRLVNETGPYDFGLAGHSGAGMTVDVTSRAGANPLTAIQVDRHDANHPQAPGDKTAGIYWTITPAGSDFVASVTLPQDGLPNPQFGRYADTRWDWSQTHSDGATVTRDGLTAFGDCAVYSGQRMTLTVQTAYGVPAPATGVTTNLEGSLLSATVTSPHVQGTTRYVCTGWRMTGSDPASGNTARCDMTVTNNAVLIWLWATNYYLHAAAGPNGSVTLASGWQTPGVTRSVTAIAAPYYHFANWSGDASGASPLVELLMDAPKSVTASFAANYTTVHPTPEPWLAQYGFTSEFDQQALDDTDHDGLANWQEYIAGTDPTNAVSVLALSSPVPVFGTNYTEHLEKSVTRRVYDVIGHSLTWPGVPGRIYSLQYSTNLLNWHDLNGATDLPGLSPANTVTDMPPARVRFYRVNVRLPAIQ